jgi:adenylate cyclase
MSVYSRIHDNAGAGGMNARLERKLRLLAVIIVVGTIAGLTVNFAQGRTSPSSMIVGTVYGLLLCVAIGGVELFVLDGPMRDWLGGLRSRPI